MMLQNPSREPADHEKAIHNPSATLNKYATEIIDASRYWESETKRAGKIGNGALLAISTAFCNYFVGSANTWNELGRTPHAPGAPEALETARRTGLSTLGVSMLMRSAWANMEVIPDFIDTDNEEGIILDMVVDTSSWKDFRVHNATTESPLTSDTREQWYKEGDLWLRRVQPGQPTEYLKNEFLPALGLAPDFAAMETLFPYVAAK
jgi:hypothetical protein